MDTLDKILAELKRLTAAVEYIAECAYDYRGYVPEREDLISDGDLQSLLESWTAVR